MSKAFVLETATDTLQFDPQTACLVSFRAKAAPEQEFIIAQADAPVFVLQYLDESCRFRQLSSRQAQVEVRVNRVGQSVVLAARFTRIEDLDLHVTVTVRASEGDRFSHWSLALENGTDLLITDVQFPFLVVSYSLAGTPGSEALLWPFGPGILIQAPKPQGLQPDCPHTWQMRPENGDYAHYPGHTFAQFLAYYNDRAGIYVACQDTEGMIKQLKPVHHDPGLRLGMSHIGDWPKRGQRDLGYDVVVGSFTGDWYAAADLYRGWALKQRWAQAPLHARKDMPGWLLDSPPHVILRIQGELDIGPTQPNEEFLPYAKAVPLLDALAKRIEAPLVPVIMSWERPGPWIYPDCFPPAGGFGSLREFTELARLRDWHIGTFCNGTRWVTGHYWSSYDGEDYFNEHGGPNSVCRTHKGEPWQELWDAIWRPSYACCVGIPLTRQIALDFVRTLVDTGLDWVQFFDQNVGACAFPCFAEDHGHPPVPGHWMTEAMSTLLDELQALYDHESQKSGGKRQFVLSVERPPNEYFMPRFHICDVRVVPPGHPLHGQGFIPLFHYLYHEFVLMQGGFGFGPEPYHMPIRNAYNLVIGEIPGAVMTGDGRLLNYDTENWAPWEPQVGDDDDSVEMLRVTAALRRGLAKDFLVYGRMLPPARVEEIQIVCWQYGGRDNQIPAVFHAAWKAPDGRFGLVLANWTKEEQQARLSDKRLGSRVMLHVMAERLTSTDHRVRRGSLALVLPPLSCALVESQGA